MDFNDDGLGECVVACGSDGSCPGDSECFQIPYLDQNNQQQVTYLCLNSAAEQGDVCPDSYVCRDAPVVDPCQNKVCGAGQVCQAGSCVTVTPPDMGTPDMGAPDLGAPDMAVVTPDMSTQVEDMASGAPDMSAGGMEPEEDALIILSEPSSSTESACLCAAPGAPVPRGLSGAWLVGLVAWRRRR